MSQVIKGKITHRQRQGDWVCPSCNNMNFAFRDSCNRCQISRHSDKDKESKGFKSALFLTESNGDISPFCDRSAEMIVNSDEKTEMKNQNISLDKLPSIEPLLQQIKKENQIKYNNFEFEWICQKCQKTNQYYKIHCNSCGAQRFRKLTA